jgi:uncharacterized protein HemX
MSEEPITSNTTLWVAIAGVIGAGITGFWSWVSGRNSSVAVLQTALTQGFKELHEQQTETNSRLRDEIKELHRCVSDLESKLAAEQQRTNSLKSLLRLHGIDIPRETVHDVVFTPYPDAVSEPAVKEPSDV